MNEKAKKYVDLFRRVKIAAAATVDAEGHPRARIINVMLAEDDGMYIVTSYNNNYGLRRGSQPRLFPSQSRNC